MKLVIRWNDQIRLFTEEVTYQSLLSFVLRQLPLTSHSIEITFADDDGDNITIASEEDLHILQSYFVGKEYVKLTVRGQKQEITDIAHQQQQKKNVVKMQQAEKRKKSGSARKQAPQIRQNISLQNQQMREGEKVKKGKKGDDTLEELKNLLNLTVAQLVDQRIKALLPCLQQQVSNPPSIVRPVVRIIHDGYECSLCFSSPIVGVRYECQVCQKFTICSRCEDTTDHPHNLLMIKHLVPPKEDPNDSNIEKICKLLMQKPLEILKRKEKQERKRLEEVKKEEQQRQKLKHAKRYLNQLFGQQPKYFNDFVKRNRQWNMEQIVRLYAESIKVADDEFNERLIDVQARRLSKKFNKQASHYKKFVRQNLHFDLNLILSSLYQSGLQKKGKKPQESQEKCEIITSPIQRMEVKKEEVIYPAISEVKKEELSNVMLSRIEGISQFKGKKQQTLSLMIDFFGASRKEEYLNFIEENKSDSKEDIVQKWASRFSIIQP